MNDPAPQKTHVIRLSVNGKRYELSVAPRDRLTDVLRGQLGLTGAAIGCDTAVCGACTVLMDRSAVKSCTVLAVQAAGSEIATIEGLSEADSLHPLQDAFIRHGAVQCGYCTAGMIMAAVDLVSRSEASLPDRVIREGISGNLCRCTGYRSIVSAIAEAARAMAGESADGRWR
ncbi:(2Fe-2S)-binding protein [Mycobacterium sp. ML1]